MIDAKVQPVSVRGDLVNAVQRACDLGGTVDICAIDLDRDRVAAQLPLQRLGGPFDDDLAPRDDRDPGVRAGRPLRGSAS